MVPGWKRRVGRVLLREADWNEEDYDPDKAFVWVFQTQNSSIF